MIQDEWEMIRLQFEQACNSLAVSPTAEIEKLVLSIRQHPQGPALCKYILEKSNNELALFHTFMAIEELMNATWSRTVTEQSLPNIAEFLFQYVFSRHRDISAWLIRRISATIATILKRGWLYPSAQETRSNQMLRENTTKIIHDLLLQKIPNFPLELFCLYLIQSLIDEFGRKNRIYDETYEYNLACFNFFENNELGLFFDIVFMHLKTYSSNFEYLSTLPQSIDVLKESIDTIQYILSWPFEQGPLILGRYNLKDSSDLRPPLTWKSRFSPEGAILNLFKKLYVGLRRSKLANTLRECWIQLATFSLPQSSQFTSHERTQFLSYWCTEFIDSYLYMCQFDFVGLDVYEIKDLAFLIKKFLSVSMIFCSLVDVVKHDLLDQLVGLIFKLTLKTSDLMTSNDDNISERFDLLQETMEIWIEVWSFLVNRHSRLVPDGSVTNYIPQVFQSCVGIRLWVADSEQSLNNPIDNFAIQNRFQSLGIIGRSACLQNLEYLLCNLLMVVRSLTYNLSTLSCNTGDEAGSILVRHQLLNPMIAAFDILKQWRLSNAGANYSTISGTGPVINYLSSSSEFLASPILINFLEKCFEELYWLLIIITHFLCSIDDDYSTMPLQISDLSCSLEESSSPDLILYLFQILFSLSSLEEVFFPLWNYLVSEAWVWLMVQFTNSYLFKKPSSTPNLSTSLIEQFGFNSPSASSILNSIISKILFNFTHWTHKPHILMLNCTLLQKIAYINDMTIDLLKELPAWQNLYDFCILQEWATFTLPFKALSHLTYSLSCFSGTDQYLQLLFHPFVDKFNEFLNNHHLDVNSENYKNSLIQHLSQLQGLARATKFASVKIIGDKLLTITDSLLKLLCFFKNEHSITKSILVFFREFSENILPLLIKNNLDAIKNIATNLFGLAQEFPSTRYLIERCQSKVAQDEMYREILLWLQIVGSLSQLPQVNEQTLMGFQAVEQFVTDDLISYPKLCSAYFQIVLNLSSEHEMLLKLNLNSFERIFKHIKNVLHLQDQGMQLIALETVADTASNNLRALKKNEVHLCPQKTAILANFMQTILKWILTANFFLEFLEVVSNVLFALICTSIDTYYKLIRILIDEKPQSKDQLCMYFGHLLSKLTVEWSKENREMFKNNLKEVLSPIRNIFNNDPGYAFEFSRQ